jgi:hypothetical protein
MILSPEPKTKTYQYISEYQVQETEYRGFKLERELKFLLWQITERLDGTRVPSVLRGKWTSLELAKPHIDAYLDSKKKPVVKKEEAANDDSD